MAAFARAKKATVSVLLAGWIVVAAAGSVAQAAQRRPAPKPLDPRGRGHIPIGIANTVDTLKTFVEAEGCFSPGVGSYGIYFWVYDPRTGKLTAPTMPGVPCKHGLTREGYLIPWSAWSAAGLNVKTEVCQVEMKTPKGRAHIVAARAHLTNTGQTQRKVFFYAALRGLGPAGWPVKHLAASEPGDALLVDGHPALIAGMKDAEAGVAAGDTVGKSAAQGKLPPDKSARSDKGDCSGAIRVLVTVPAGKTVTLGFICPVLPGRRAVAHDWDGRSGWAQLDLAKPNPPTGGLLQPDAPLDYYRKLDVNKMFDRARAYWRDLVGRATIRLPDPRWAQALAAITGHAAVTMNQGAPDVAVVNYNVFNRDGVYIANILQKAGRLDLSEAAIDYFLSHPFNGRTRVEADNPGQVLWAIGQHWLYSRDRRWLKRVYPAAAKIAAMIRYYRTSPGPHYVKATSLEFGDSLPPDKPDDRPANKRQVLRPGSCDGNHPEYTEAFDVAGLRSAAMLARAAGKADHADAWGKLAGKLFDEYHKKFSKRLARGYGSYCVLWPCRLYSLSDGKAHEQFKGIGVQGPSGWRYFPLARAHQGLLAGNRGAGWQTIEKHLDHAQMRGWYAFDEGGRSGQGGWRHLRTTWPHGVAMPHGWAIAELHLLLRDSVLFEDEDRLVLLAGVKEAWFSAAEGMAAANMPTHFGNCSFAWKPAAKGAIFELTGDAAPPKGFVLCLPPKLGARASVGGKLVRVADDGRCIIPATAKRVDLSF